MDSNLDAPRTPLPYLGDSKNNHKTSNIGEIEMKNRTLFAIYGVNLSVLWVCSGLLPLLPIYAAELGATTAMTGNYLALAFLGTALGTVGAGWLSARLRHRRVLIMIAGLLSAPATWLMGQAATVGQLALWTTVVWLLAGSTLSMVNVLAGLSAEPHRRGRTFGLLGLTSALASVLGGLMSGPIADFWGYETLLTVMAFFWLAQVAGGVLIREPRPTKSVSGSAISNAAPAQIPWPLILLLGANFLLSTARFWGGMAQTWAMDAQGFSAAAVTIIAAVGAGAGILINPMAGRLSDIYGRRTVLFLTYTGAALALAVMAASSTLAHFLLVAVLMTVAYAADAVAPAFVTDVVSSGQLDRWMSIFATTRWLGAIAGYASSGYAVHAIGLDATLLTSVSLPILAVLLLLQIRRAGEQSNPLSAVTDPTVAPATR